MKKRIVALMLSLVLLFGMTACWIEEGGGEKVKGLEIASASLEKQGLELVGSVSAETEFFDFYSDLSVSADAEYIVATDISCQDNFPSKIVSLKPGDNVFYILVKNGKDQCLYKAIVRRAPIYEVVFRWENGDEIERRNVEEGTTITPPELSRLGYVVAWSYDFSKPVTSNMVIKAAWVSDGIGLDFSDNLDDYRDSMDFSNMGEFVISYFDLYSYEVYADEKSTDKLDTLIYNRNKLLEARFGTKISQQGKIQSTGTTDLTSHYNYVQSALNSGDVPFDAIAMYAYNAGKLILGNGGNFLDWRSEVPYAKDSIKAGEEWWPTDINRDSTVMGHQFVAVSDFCITAMEMTYTVIFNKSLAKSSNVAMGVDNTKYDTTSTLYDVVRGNDWTLDTMKSIVSGFYRNNATSGNTSGIDVEDRFGLVAAKGTDADAWAFAFGYNYIENDGVSAPALWDWDGSQFDVITSLRELYGYNGTWANVVGTAYDDYNARAAFFAQEDKVLFQLNTLESLKWDVIHNMEQDFGVLPYPKYLASQAKFYTGSLDHYTVLAVPYTTAFDEERLRMTGAFIEALSAENCNSVKNPYYDEIVTHHNVTDGDSVEMINIIMNGRVYDLGVYHYNELELAVGADNGSFALFFRYLLQNKDQDIVQYWTSNSGGLEGRLDSLLGDYAGILR